MRRLLQNTSLSAQLIGLTAFSIVLISTAVIVVLAKVLPPLPTGDGPPIELAVALTVTVVAALCLLPIMAWLRQARRLNQSAEQAITQRTRTVDRLLEFSQAIQGAGQADQIFPALAHFLQTELGLAGLAVLVHDAEAIPPIQVKATWPENVVDPAHPLPEMDTSICPSLRQNLAREFRSDGPPIRCSIDQHLRLPKTLAAYCIPFHIGKNTRGVAHMVLPAGQTWAEQQKQLAQTYVTTACSSLISLYMLAEAEKQSLTDSLTGLYNRRSMEQMLLREVALAERHEHSLSVVMIDMDHFKTINDVHGHAAGDHLLRAFADCVRITLRKTDWAFRYGGDEFVIALPQTPLAQAQAVVQKLRQAFAAVDFSHAITHLERQPTLSIGLAERSATGGILTLQNLLWAADQALYDAKSGSRNCVRIYQPRAA